MAITPNVHPSSLEYSDTIPMVVGRKIKVQLTGGDEASDTPVEFIIPEGHNSAEVYLYVKVSLQCDELNGGE